MSDDTMMILDRLGDCTERGLLLAIQENKDEVALTAYIDYLMENDRIASANIMKKKLELKKNDPRKHAEPRHLMS